MRPMLWTVMVAALAAFGGCERRGEQAPAAQSPPRTDAMGTKPMVMIDEKLGATAPAGDPTGATGSLDSEQPTKKGDAGGERSGAAGGAMKNDVVFAQEATVHHLLEVEAARLAAERGSERKVKEFATMMLRDHGEANQELSRIAHTKGIPLPRELNEEKAANLERLHALAGPEFDRDYAALMMQGHVHDVNMFEQQARSGEDPELRAYAERTLTRLRHHLEAARQLPGAAG